MRPGWLIAVALVAMACNQAVATPTSNVASSSRVLVAAPDFGDQPSFADRTGRLPVLSLQSLFHPAYIVPADPTPNSGGGIRYYRQQNPINNTCTYPVGIATIAIFVPLSCSTKSR